MFIDILNTNKKYSIIYADPPWAYKQSGNGCAKKHYDTLSTDDICKFSIPSIAKNDAIIFMWATFPNIKEAFKVMDAWGFTYKTVAFVWIKKNRKSGTNFFGNGSYTRSNAEVCLLGISKSTKAKQAVINHSISQIIEYPIGKHSEKPPIVRDKIVELLGDVPRIELFARQYAAGWDCWGNEVGGDKNDV